MSAYMVITYDVSDPERFADYNPASLKEIRATIANYGGEIVFAGPPEALTGSVESSVVGLKFADAETAKAWLDDAEYAPLKAIRFESTTNISEYIVPGLD